MSTAILSHSFRPFMRKSVTSDDINYDGDIEIIEMMNNLQRLTLKQSQREARSSERDEILLCLE